MQKYCELDFAARGKVIQGLWFLWKWTERESNIVTVLITCC